MEVRAVVVALVTTGLLATVNAEPRDQFVFRLLTVYQGGPDQAAAADRDSNNVISDNEFLQSLFFFTDNKGDRRVTQAEFVDGYRRRFGLPSELLVIMFDLLDDLNDDKSERHTSDARDNRNNEFFDMFSKLSPRDGLFDDNQQKHGDGILTPHDVTVRKFAGGESQRFSKEDYKKFLMKWVAAAADRLYSINYQPHIPGNPWDKEFDYERWFTSVDRNNDSLVAFGELRDEFRRYSPDGRVQRSQWVERNLNRYGDREWLANVVFDYWDKNMDLRLDDVDIARVLREADRNRDMQVTTIEFHRFMEKYNKRARRRLATPIRPVMYDCPSPWWQSFGCRPRVDATRAAMDMDDNFDGWITRGELRKRVSYYDRNGDGWASREEVTMMETMRYGVKGPTASVMFDVYDRNGDGRYDLTDLQYMLSDGRVLCFCDARRAILDLVKLSEKFRNSPQARGPAGSLRNAMRWHMARDRQWRRRVELLWHRIWGGQAGLGASCREGDCTGKDWRGETWYSPFDWRQRNRVPENFLQWAYLQNVPRTLSSPGGRGPTFGGNSVFFFPPSEGAANPWRPRGENGWPRGGNRELGGPRNTGDNGAGSDLAFPGGGSRGQRPGGFRPPPDDFLPNPSKVTSAKKTLPQAFQISPNSRRSFSGTGEPQGRPRVRGEGDAGGGDLWDRVLAVRRSGRAFEQGEAADADHQEPLHDEEDELFSLTQPGGVESDVPNSGGWPLWTWKSRDSPRSGISRKDQEDRGKATMERTAEENLRNGGAVEGDTTTTTTNNDDDEKQSQSRGNSRLRRNAVDDVKTQSPSDADPPTTARPEPDADDADAKGNPSTKMDSDFKPTDPPAAAVDEAQVQVARATSREDNNPSLYSYWLRGARDWADCDQADPWTEQGNADDPTTYGAGWGPPAGGLNPWQQAGYWPSPGNGLPRSEEAPRWWNFNNWRGSWDHGNNRPSFRNWDDLNRPFSFAKAGQQVQPGEERLRSKRSSDEKQPDQVSRMMGGYGGYWPQWWNRGNYNYNWPSHWNNRNSRWNNDWNNMHWNNYNWMQNNYGANRPFSFSREGEHEKIREKRSADKTKDEEEDVSRMMGGYGGYGSYWPQWRNWGNHYKWPGYWNNMNNYNWVNNNPGFQRPFSFSREEQNQNIRLKRSADKKTDDEDKVSRMMGGYDGYRPRWWNWGSNYWKNWPTYRNNYWNNYWNNWNGMYGNNYNWRNTFDSYYPFSYSQGEQTQQSENIRAKRSADKKADEEDEVSRMMGGYGGYRPQWWSWGNNYRNNWPSYWNNWDGYWNNWNGMYGTNYNRRNTYGGYYPFSYSRGEQTHRSENIRAKRSADQKTDEDDKVSRMMGGYTGYWPQWWNWGNKYNWPGSWNNWNGYWNNMHWNNYNWNNHDVFHPYSFSQEGKTSTDQNIRAKRSTDKKADDEDDVSRMMGGHGGYWPQWGNWGNRYWKKNWPGYWNNWKWNNMYWKNYYWMRNSFGGYRPFSFSQEGKESTDHNVRAKRSADQESEEEDKVSRMMGGYGGYRPQWWNWGNKYNWPGYWNNWSRNWNTMYWNNYNRMRNSFGSYHPFSFSQEGKTSTNPHIRAKRSADKTTDDEDEVSRMTGGDGGYWPQWWNWGNNYWRNWPRYWNNWNGNWNNMPWNNYNWNNYDGFHPLSFSQAEQNENVRPKRNADKKTEDHDGNKVSRMMGSYDGYWPLGWYQGYNYNYWPSDMNNWNDHWNNWNGRWNWNSDDNYDGRWSNPFMFSTDGQQDRTNKLHIISKRSSGEKQTDQVSRMMGGHAGYWPQWGNWGSSYRKNWPSYWNRNWNSMHWNNLNWVRNGFSGFRRPISFSQAGQKENMRAKRSADQKTDDEDEVSRMMGGYSGYWPQRWNWENYYNNLPGDWNNWNSRWNNYWNNMHMNDYNWRRNSYGASHPLSYSQEEESEKTRAKRSAGKTTDDEDEVSRMMGGYGGYRPQWWNWGNNYKRNWPRYGNNWNSYWNNWNGIYGNNYNWRNTYGDFYPFSYSQGQQSQQSENIRAKRSAYEKKKDDNERDEVSSMMGGYGGYGPQWRNWGNDYRKSWPSHWNENWNRMYLNSMYQNNYNWMRSGFGGYRPFSFSQEGKASTNQNIRAKRSADKKTDDEDEVSRMMGGHGDYRPQWWNWGKNYNNWPGYWNNWNRYWNDWNGMHGNNNNWMRNTYGDFYPFSYSQGQQSENIRAKRSADKKTDDEDEVSRMMGGYGGYWPQWWNWGNYYNNWPGDWKHWNSRRNNYWNNMDWNNYNWMQNNYGASQPLSYSQEEESEKIREKRSADKMKDEEDKVSRMMGGYGGYGGYWPQWWNWGNNYRRNWPRYGNNWNSYLNNWNGMYGNNYNWRNTYDDFYPFSYSQGQQSHQSDNIRAKRSSDKKTDDEDEVSRMMGGYSGHWPEWWNWGNNYNNWPGYWNNYFWMRYNHGDSHPSSFSRGEQDQNIRPKRSADEKADEEETEASESDRNSGSTDSGAEPDVAEQLGGWPGSRHQQRRWQMKRLVNSRPRFWGRSRYGSVLAYPYGFLHSKRYMYGAYRIPVIVYRIRNWRNRRWNVFRNAWSTPFSSYSFSPRVSASSSGLSAPHKAENAEAAKETEAEENSEPEGRPRSKRSLGNHGDAYPTNAAGVYGDRSWPRNDWNAPGNPRWVSDRFWFMNRQLVPGNGMHTKGWHWDHPGGNPWNAQGNVHPFAFSADDTTSHEQSPQRLRKRSADAAGSTRGQSSPDESDLEVSRWMSGFHPEPPFVPVSLGLRPYSVQPPPSLALRLPEFMNQPWRGAPWQDWQFTGSRFQRHSVSWNSWSGSSSTSHGSSGLGGGFPFAFSSEEGSDARDADLRQKRSSNGNVLKKKKKANVATDAEVRQKRGTSDEERKEEMVDVDTEENPGVGRMGRGFTDTHFSGPWSMLAPRFGNGERWRRLNWPGLRTFRNRPWWSSLNSWSPNQYYALRYPNEYGSTWSQYTRTPSWNRYYPNGPAWAWRRPDANQNRNSWQRTRNGADPFSGDYVEENFNDPLSSFHFSRKDASNDAEVDQVDERRTSGQDTAAAKQPVDEEGAGDPRRKRSVSSLAGVLFKGQSPAAGTKPSLVSVNRRLAKRGVKRFSTEAVARLEKRFQKRSAASEADSVPGKANPAAKQSMRATASARGHSDRDREWEPREGNGFPRNPNRNTVRPNSNHNPNWNTGPGSASASGQAVNTYDSSDRRNWNQPGMNGNQNWFEKQGPGDAGRGQSAGSGGYGNAGTTNSRGGSYYHNNNNNADDGNGNPTNSGSNNRLDNVNNNVNVNKRDPLNQDDTNATTGTADNSKQGGNWFGLLTYGPHFWEDEDDLDLWDPAWGQDGPWAAGYVLVPARNGWEAALRGGCPDQWFPPKSTRDWWNPEQSADVAGWRLPISDAGFNDWFRPYSPTYLSLIEDSRSNPLLPSAYFFRSDPSDYYVVIRSTPLSPFDPAFVDSTGIYWGRGQPATGDNPWWPRYREPWVGGGNLRKGWNPWQYRIQYRSTMDHDVRRSRRSAPGPVGDQPVPVDPASLSSAGRETASFPPRGTQAAPSRTADEDAGDSRPQWWNLPWWDRNNWHGARSGYDVSSSPSGANPAQVFPRDGGAVGGLDYGRFPANAGPADDGLGPAGGAARAAAIGNVPYGSGGDSFGGGPASSFGGRVSSPGWLGPGGGGRSNPRGGGHLFLPSFPPSPFLGRAGLAKGEFPQSFASPPPPPPPTTTTAAHRRAEGPTTLDPCPSEVKRVENGQGRILGN